MKRPYNCRRFMKPLVLLILALLPMTTFASISNEGYLINSKLEYFNGKETIKIEKDLILPDGNKNWTTLTDIKDGVILLGRRVETQDKNIRLEYIVLDTKKSPNGVVSLPVIISPVGEPTAANFEKDISPNSKIKLSLSASRTTFDLP